MDAGYDYAVSYTFPCLWPSCQITIITINLSPALENGGNPFNMLGGMGGNMTQQLAGLMGMQGMGMQGMVSCPNLILS